jgi:hypothetical protein
MEKEQPNPFCYTMSVEDAGRIYFGLSRSASYAAAKRGDIPTIPIGRRKLRVPIAAMERRISAIVDAFVNPLVSSESQAKQQGGGGQTRPRHDAAGARRSDDGAPRTSYNALVEVATAERSPTGNDPCARHCVFPAPGRYQVYSRVRRPRRVRSNRADAPPRDKEST